MVEPGALFEVGSVWPPGSEDGETCVGLDFYCFYSKPRIPVGKPEIGGITRVVPAFYVPGANR